MGARAISLVLSVAGLCAFTMYAHFLATWGISIWGIVATLPEGHSTSVDFSAFWGAARLALDGQWLAPFYPEELGRARNPVPGQDRNQLWLYPPGFLLLVAPLGALSFPVAWGVFVAASLGVFLLALRPVLRPLGPLAWGVLGAPAVVVCIGLGQTSLLFGGLLVWGIEAIRTRQDRRAGVVCAVLTLKPQLGLALMAALLAGRCWRVILWGVAATAALLAVTVIHPGLAYWMHFFTAMWVTATEFGESNLAGLMITPYGSARVAGLGDLAILVHGVVALSVMAGLGWLWSQRSVAFDAKAAALCLATPLVTPYALHYELLVVLVGAVYLLRWAGPRQRVWQLWVGLIWALPMIGYYQLPVPGRALASLVVLAALGHLLWETSRAAQQGQARSGPAPMV